MISCILLGDCNLINFTSFAVSASSSQKDLSPGPGAHFPPPPGLPQRQLRLSCQLNRVALRTKRDKRMGLTWFD